MRFRSSALLLGFTTLAAWGLAQDQQPRPNPSQSRNVSDQATLPPQAKLRLGSTLFRQSGYNRLSAITPDGQSIVQFQQPDHLQWIEIKTGRNSKRIKLSEQISNGNMLAFSPSGKRLLVISYNGAYIVDPTTGQVEGQVTPQNAGKAAGGRVQRITDSLSEGLVTITGNGHRLACGTRYPQKPNESFAYVYDTEKNDLICELPVIQANSIQAVLSHDGKRLATFGQYYVRNTEENTAPLVQLWDVDNKKELHRLSTSTNLVTAACFSPDGKTVYTAGQSGPVEAWDVASGQKLRQYITRSNIGVKIFVSADGKRLASCSNDGAVQVWEAESAKRLGTGFAPTNMVDSIALPPDRPAVAYGMYSSTMQVWTVPGEILTPQNGHFGPVNQIQFSADGQEILSTGTDGRIVKWNTQTGEELAAYGYQNPQVRATTRRQRSTDTSWNHSWNVSSGIISPDFRTIFLPANGGIAAVDVASGQEDYTLFFPKSRGGSSSIRPSMSADGRKVGAASQYYERNKYIFSATAWDTQTGQTHAEIRTELDNTRRYLNGMATAISPSGKYFSVLCNFYDNRNGQVTSEFTSFDLTTGQKFATGTQSGRSYSPFLLAAPDNRSVISRDQQNHLLIWDMPTGNVVRTFKSFTSSQSLTPAFHPNGRTFAVSASTPPDPARGQSGYMIRIVEWASGEVRDELPVDSSSITTMEFSPDGKTLATGWYDSTILLFDTTPADDSKPWQDKPTEPAKLWDQLTGSSARAAWQAMRELTDRPEVAVNLIRENIKPVPAPSQPFR